MDASLADRAATDDERHSLSSATLRAADGSVRAKEEEEDEEEVAEEEDVLSLPVPLLPTGVCAVKRLWLRLGCWCWRGVIGCCLVLYEELTAAALTAREGKEENEDAEADDDDDDDDEADDEAAKRAAEAEFEKEGRTTDEAARGRGGAPDDMVGEGGKDGGRKGGAVLG